jgi:dTDP-4-amino-4,6-dideoxygalactose transaminase
MASSQKEKSDFRYNTGDAKVPWDAVAVKPDADLVNAVLRFLVQEGSDAAAYAAAMKKVEKAVGGLFKTGKPASKLSLGKNVNAVEELAKEMLGVRYASFLVNWTAGYDIALDMAGVKAGDEVIVPAITFIATAAAVLRKGAGVVFADVDRQTINMDPADVARKISPRTRAIVPVHIGGYPVDMDPIMELARSRGIAVIEDAAHGFGGTYKGRKLGAIGDFGAYSFHEVKNITALGEGGILVSNDDLGAQFPMARFCGFDLISPPPPTWLYNISPVRSRHGSFVAGNYSTTEIQAVALLQQMKRNDEIIAARRRVARYLHDKLVGVRGLIPGPLDSADYGGTFHLFLLRVDPTLIRGGIQALKAKLTERGVTQIAHFCPLYHYRLFEELGYNRRALQESCPMAEKVFFEEYTHLPLYDLPAESIDYMVDTVTAAARELAV